MGSVREIDRARGSESPALSFARPPLRPFPVGVKTPAFKAVYTRYPNKHGEMAAAAVFAEIAETYPGGDVGLRDAILRAFDGGMLAHHPYNAPEARFRPKLETVLAKRQWEDDWTAAVDVPASAGGVSKSDPKVGYGRPGTAQAHTRSGKQEDF